MPEMAFAKREEEQMLTVKIENSQPIDLVDLTTSFMALADEFQSFAGSKNDDHSIPNMKLYVRELRSGSIIAELIPIAQQADWLLDHKDALGAFVTNLNDTIQFFLGSEKRALVGAPTRAEAERISKIVEPVAKDSASQLIIQASDFAKVEVHHHIHLESRDANALQNGVRRFLGPDLPAEAIKHDQLMVLDQVKNVASSKTGDRAIIEAIWPNAVRLQFMSDQAKRQVLELDENPFQKVFIVDVEIRSVGGKPALYRVIEVKDTIERP